MPVMATRCGPDSWRGPGRLMETVAVGSPKPGGARWPAHLPVGALRVVRWSARYDQTVVFYPDIIGLPLLETFQDSYGLDGTILGLPGGAVHLEIVRLRDGQDPAPGLISWCSTCPMLPPKSGSPRGWPPRAWTRGAD